MLRLLSILVVFLALTQCVKAATRIPTDKVQHLEGKRLYVLHCTNCHNARPNLQGSIGPPILTTTYEAFKLKVIEGKYPVNYKPIRKTTLMPPFPTLKNRIDNIYNYIQTFK
jgi:mono/diheme cytochrome c family protein